MTTISTIGLNCALREAPFVVPRDYVEQYGRRDELRRYRLHRRAIDSAPFSSLVRPATSCARNVSGYPRSSSNSYHAANAERTETIARSRGGIGRAPRSEVSKARDRSGPRSIDSIR